MLPQPAMAGPPNIRVARKLVERGDAPLGIVYATDAKVSPGVKTIGTFRKFSPRNHLSRSRHRDREARSSALPRISTLNGR